METEESVEAIVEETPQPIEDRVKETETQKEEVADTKKTEETAESNENGIEVNSASDDIILGEDEYKGDNPLDVGYEGEDLLDIDEDGIVDEVMKQLREEHPEWFTSEGSTNNTTPQYENVGTPDNTANTPRIVFGQGGYNSDLVGGTVY